MKRPRLTEAQCGHFETEEDGADVFVCDVEHVWTRRGGGDWVPARSPSRVQRRDWRSHDSLLGSAAPPREGGVRHPRRAHVAVLRPGKTMPPVVVSSHLHVKGVGVVHTGPGHFFVRRITYGKSVREMNVHGSTWTAPWEEPRRRA